MWYVTIDVFIITSLPYLSFCSWYYFHLICPTTAPSIRFSKKVPSCLIDAGIGMGADAGLKQPICRWHSRKPGSKFVPELPGVSINWFCYVASVTGRWRWNQVVTSTAGCLPSFIRLCRGLVLTFCVYIESRIRHSGGSLWCKCCESILNYKILPVQ